LQKDLPVTEFTWSFR